jgi:hypothetical protein
MAKFIIGGSFGFGLGAGGANGKKNWVKSLINKISGKSQTTEEEGKQPQEQVSGKAGAGLGGLGLQYSMEMELSIAEMRELYQLTHSDEEWSFDRSVSEIKSLGRGIKNLANKFVADNGNSIKAVWNTACDVYEAAKRRDYETTRVDREIQLAQFKDHLELDREEDRLRREDQRLREAEKAAEEEKAKQKK